MMRADQSRIRGSPPEQKKEDEDDVLPTLQMMIRVLPSTNCGSQRGYFGVRAYALHAFGLLLAYSNKLRGETLGPDGMQLLQKAVGVVEDNFLAAWTIVSADKDQGNEVRL
jgi:Na+-translocating ferredoxin:NAD+ oxidoreductase RNF subunit RnfB